MSDSITVDIGDGKWSCLIGEHPRDQTIVFEGSNDDVNWEPVKGKRISGPVNVGYASIITNAVAGGPAEFRGQTLFRAIRARCPNYAGFPIPISLVTSIGTYPAVITGKEPFIFVINEELTLEEALSES